MKAIKISVLCPYTHPIIYPKCIGNGVQNNVKPNILSSAMTVCRHGFHNGVMAYMVNVLFTEFLWCE